MCASEALVGGEAANAREEVTACSLMECNGIRAIRVVSPEQELTDRLAPDVRPIRLCENFFFLRKFDYKIPNFVVAKYLLDILC